MLTRLCAIAAALTLVSACRTSAADKSSDVKDVTVRGHPNPITGEVVAARITTLAPEDPDAFKLRVRQFCRARLERYKIPAVIDVVVEDHYGARFKKSRNQTSIQHGNSSQILCHQYPYQ